MCVWVRYSIKCHERIAEVRETLFFSNPLSIPLSFHHSYHGCQVYDRQAISTHDAHTSIEGEKVWERTASFCFLKPFEYDAENQSWYKMSFPDSSILLSFVQPADINCCDGRIICYSVYLPFALRGMLIRLEQTVHIERTEWGDCRLWGSAVSHPHSMLTTGVKRTIASYANI